MASADLRDELQCSICLSLYTDPVTLGCGHNFCRDCIDQHLDTQDWGGGYSCPECREKFQDRPVLKRNVALHNVTEHLKSTPPQQEAVTRIFCNNCGNSRVPAVRSCLQCETFLCDNHLRVHSKGPEHILIEIPTFLEKYKCSVHGGHMKYYCTTDTICICKSCHLFGAHRGHRVEMLNVAFERKKTQLKNFLPKVKNKLKETEGRVQSLEKQWREAQEKASGEAERALLQSSIRGRESLLLNIKINKIQSEISRQEMQVSLSLSALIHKKDELSRKMKHIEELCNMTDPLTVLQEPDPGDLCDPEEGGGDEDNLCIYVPTHNVDIIARRLPPDLSDRIREPMSPPLLLPPQPTFRFPTSHTQESGTNFVNNTVAARSGGVQSQCPETPTQSPQVISKKSFSSGRHYWEVEVSPAGEWRVGMCYSSMERAREVTLIGDNTKSWSLRRKLYRDYTARHNGKKIKLTSKISSNRFRISLDYEAGKLSFSELCDPVRHLHTFKVTFTEPLHPAYYTDGARVRILD